MTRSNLFQQPPLDPGTLSILFYTFPLPGTTDIGDKEKDPLFSLYCLSNDKNSFMLNVLAGLQKDQQTPRIEMVA